MHDLHVEMRAVASTDGSAGLASIDMAKIALKSAPLSVRVPPLVAPKLAYAKYVRPPLLLEPTHSDMPSLLFLR